MAIHVVNRGDTLYSISRTYRINIAKIREVNGLTSEILMPGLALYLPIETLPTQYYSIKAGDTLWRIGQRFQTSIPSILQANPGVVAENIYIGQIITIPTPMRYTMETLAFIDTFIPTSIGEKLSAYSDQLSYLALFTYSVTPTGTLIEADDRALIQEIKQNNVKPLMVFSNYANNAFSSELAAQVLQSEIRSIMINNIVRTLRNKGYAGISLDFEMIPPTHRDAFTAFLRELKQAMGNLILHVSVFSKEADMPTNPFAGAFDYAAIGQIADIVTVLTYDYGYVVGPPDPIAPTWWINQVLSYATTLIPRNKLMIAIPFYGYDWLTPDTPEVNAKTLSVNAAQNQALQKYTVINYNTVAEAPFYSYVSNGQVRTVWFEDPRSMVAKYKLIEAYNLLGVSYWRFRYDFPQNWSYLQNNIQVSK